MEQQKRREDAHALRKSRECRTKQNQHAAFVVSIRWLVAAPADNMASPENLRHRHTDSLAKAAGLKGRCDQLQVLSRGLTLAGSRQDLLHEPTSVLVAVRVKQRGFIGLNTLQGTSHRVLLLSGRLYCDRTETDDGHSNQHCRDEACSDRNLVLHKVARIRGIRTTVNNKKQKSYRGTLGRAGQVDGRPEKSIRFSPT